MEANGDTCMYSQLVPLSIATIIDGDHSGDAWRQAGHRSSHSPGPTKQPRRESERFLLSLSLCHLFHTLRHAHSVHGFTAVQKKQKCAGQRHSMPCSSMRCSTLTQTHSLHPCPPHQFSGVVVNKQRKGEKKTQQKKRGLALVSLYFFSHHSDGCPDHEYYKVALVFCHSPSFFILLLSSFFLFLSSLPVLFHLHRTLCLLAPSIPTFLRPYLTR